MSRKPSRIPLAAGVLLLLCATASAADFRPPAVPLVTIDPYTSCWSMSDTLAGDWPRHWTGSVHAMCGFIRVDGKPLPLHGPARPKCPSGRTDRDWKCGPRKRVYRFRAGGVNLAVTFTAPLLLDDLELLSRPANYITFEVASGRRQAARGANLFRRHGRMGRQQAAASRSSGPARRPMGLDAMRIGTRDQRVLATKGDNVRIDWGYLYVAAPTRPRGPRDRLRQAVARGAFAEEDVPRQRATTPRCRARPTIAGRCWPSRFRPGNRSKRSPVRGT